MPPVLSRKRLRPDSESPEPPSKRAARTPASRRTKESVFNALDAAPTVSRTLSQTKAILEQEDDDSELSEPESSEEEFEDVPISAKSHGKAAAQAADESEEEWEDALDSHRTNHEAEPEPVISGDIELTLSGAPTPATFERSDGKRGPSKIQRHIRNVTHCMHVQFLMFHNLVRNSWVQDQQVQKILIEHLNTGCWRELDRYWRDAGISNGPERVVQGGWSQKKADELKNAGSWKSSGQNGVKVYESPASKSAKSKTEQTKLKTGSKPRQSSGKNGRSSDRNQRDWGATSDRLEPNTPNLSAGDPLLRLMKYLSAFWKSKYKITVPSLRKRGYLPPSTLEAEIGAWKDHPSEADAFGERVENLDSFRDLARKCEGSRDVGEQFFTALLRGLGIEARMVASLQPIGFGWSQNEEGKPKNLEGLKEREKSSQTNPDASTSAKGKGKGNSRPVNGTKGAPIDLSESDSDLSSVVSISSGSEAVQKPAKKSPKARKYGEELPHPTYWTEAISHLTYTPVIVSPLPKAVIAASNMPEQLLSFYCRGASADKAKQVFAYLIAFSSDGTAKDVTTRYLPKHQWPGKTKGIRMPVEKIPIHNKRGKVKRWEEWDWFKSVLRPYARPLEKRQPWDEVEDEGDLVAAKPAKPKDMDEEGGKETLQGYKNSAEYVLERHLRREEALRPGAKIVRHFTTGKGDNIKQEPVYRRRDIVNCKTVESWHKEGRAVMEGEQPLKYVPMRAVTVTRKREIEEREREEGEKIKQGLYSKEQTDWIIPDPIVDGKIPRNAFGNIDVYVPTMVPKGAVHIPLRGTARVCRKLNIDYAEACTGFEFGKQRAVPVLTGVVVAVENEDIVIDAWEAEEAEKARKEQDKKEKLVLGLWKKFFTGLRIVERMKREYGDEAELPAAEPAPSNTEKKKSEWDTFHAHDDFEGGFLREEPGPSEQPAGGFIRDDEEMAGGFLPSSPEESRRAELTIDHGEQEQPKHISTPTLQHGAPISLSKHVDDGTEAHRSDDEVEDEDEDAEPLPRPTRRTRGTTQTSRGRPRGRPAKRGSTSTRKIPADSSEEEDEESPLSDPESDAKSSPTSLPDDAGEDQHQDLDKDEDASEDEGDDAEAEPEPTPRRTSKRKAASSPQATRQAPKRRAARRSEASVKSHFFAHGSDEETDFTDRSPRKGGVGRGRGGVRGGRGRGRGRGRGGGK